METIRGSVEAERIAQLEAENASLRDLLSVYMGISAEWGNQVRDLRKKHNEPWPIVEGL